MLKKVLILTILFLPFILFGDYWTLCGYIDADNNLNSAGQDDVDEMETYCNSTQYNVIIQIDASSSGLKDVNGTFKTCRRYHLVNGNNSNSTIDVSYITDIGEASMGTWTTLRDFGNWAISTYPADKYFLWVWDHGNDWTKSPAIKDMMNDDSDGSSIHFADAKPSQYERALYGIKNNSLNGKDLNLMGFDACLMGMAEIMTITKPYAEIQVSSEETEPGDGWEYQYWLDAVDADPDIAPEELAKELVRAYAQRYDGTGGNNPPTFSAVRLKMEFNKFLEALDNFARELILAGGYSQSDISTARQNAYEFYVSEQRDLWDFADNIANDNDLPQSLRAAAESLKYWIGWENNWDGNDNLNATGNGILIAEWHDESGPHGVAIYTGSITSSSNYLNHRICDYTLWDEFLLGYTSLGGVTNVTFHDYRRTQSGGVFTVDDGPGGDGIPDPGETISFYLTVNNSGGATATGVSATIDIDNTNYATRIDSTCTFPDITGGSYHIASNDPVTIQISNSAPAGEWIDVIVTLTYNGKATQEWSFSLKIGAPPLATYGANLMCSFNDYGIVDVQIDIRNAGQYDYLVLERANVPGNYQRIQLFSNPGPGSHRLHYTDYETQQGNTYTYRLVGVRSSGVTKVITTKTVKVPFIHQVKTEIERVEPFAKTSGAKIQFSINKPGEYELFVIDQIGRRVKLINRGRYERGEHIEYWQKEDDAGNPLPGGVYWIILRGEGQKSVKKTFVIR